MTRRVRKSAEWLVSCILNVLGATAVGKLEVVGSYPAVGHILYNFSDTR